MGPIPLAARTPVSDAVREVRAVIVGSSDQRHTAYPHLSTTHTNAPASYVALPLLADDHAVGALVLGWREPREPTGTEVAFLLALARQSAQALERAWLYEAEQVARREAESTAARLRLQQDLTAQLSGAVDTAAVADVILRHATTALGARGAVLHHVDERSRTFVLLAAHGTPVDRDYHVVPFDAPLPICDAVRAREPVLVAAAGRAPDADPDAVSAAAGATTAFVVVPLLLDDRAVGALSVTWSAAVEYGTADGEFLAAVAAQCAQALDRARLYDETRSVARTLQGSLLPTRPPTIPGLEVAVRYRPISRRNEVGGDFYDVFRIAPGHWGVVIGDVSGKGVPAASLTALARYTVRAAVKRELTPADVLRFLNEAILDASPDAERFATVAYLDVRVAPEGARARLAVGGHPLPVLRTADGQIRSIGRPGMAVGLLPMAEVDDVEISLGAGDTVVLYTDGVVEARSPEGEFAGDLVEEVLLAGGAPDAETVADRIERATLDFQAGDPRDDIAVVVLRVPDHSDVAWGRTASVAVTLERDPSSVAEARRVVAAFLAEQQLQAVADTAVLLTSEVVTNAVLHARTAVGFRVAAVGDRLRVEVSDGSRARPVRREVRTDSRSGRGLLLLDRLAAAWDVRTTPDGKLVWFELDLSPSS
jgi:serine phosphatase RsbU (regulator of sigma subunit)/anti-sigma regulatory factor (Ser/Thr protein kinase)